MMSFRQLESISDLYRTPIKSYSTKWQLAFHSESDNSVYM